MAKTFLHLKDLDSLLKHNANLAMILNLKCTCTFKTCYRHNIIEYTKKNTHTYTQTHTYATHTHTHTNANEF